MNIYEKMQHIRCKLQKSGLKKSGKNAFAKYEYFELQDIMPTINNLMYEYKITSEISFTEILATLRIINAEKVDEIMTFTCPMAKALLKGCHEVQNLGASITYLRRYLYINAFEVVEHDALDATNNGTNGVIEHIDEAQQNTIMDMIVVKGVDVEKFCIAYGIKAVEALPKSKYQAAFDILKAKKDAS